MLYCTVDSFVTCFIYSAPSLFLRYLLVQDWFSESIIIAIYCFIIWIQFVSFLYCWWKFLVIFLYSKPQCSEWVYVFPCTNSQQFFWVYSCKWNQQDMEYAYLHFFLLFAAKFFCNLYSAVYQTSCLTNTVMNEFKVFATQMGMNVYLLLTSITFFFLKSPYATR